VPRSALVQGQFRFLPPERVVIEVLEDVEADPDVMRALRSARAAGYSIALDDFVLNERTRALVDLADYVKIDVLGRSFEDVAATHASIARRGLKLLAEKIESHEMQRAALGAGYDLFQGYYFARPESVRGRPMETDRNAMLRLFAEIQDPATTLERIEELVAADLGLTVRVLRYVNSAFTGMRERVDSLRHAILMLGLQRLRDCVSILILAGLGQKPAHLVTLALVRARMCEVLGEAVGKESHRHFSVGLLSLLDAFLDQPIDEAVERMGLAEDLNNALLRREGILGASVRVAEACERGAWEELEGTRWDPTAVRAAYLDALRWSGRVQSSLVAA
jgi:EAL and modified HD-GYP domain-containing signal transduction protein